MATEFDYNSPDVSATAVADVVAAITSAGKLPPLSDEEREIRRLEKEAYRRECRRRDEERRIDRERQQAEAEAIARAELAAEIAERNRKQRLERAAEIERQTREIELRDLRMRVTQQSAWQQSVDRAAANALAYRQRATLLNELDAIINPPQPVETDVDVGYDDRSGDE